MKQSNTGPHFKVGDIVRIQNRPLKGSLLAIIDNVHDTDLNYNYSYDITIPVNLNTEFVSAIRDQNRYLWRFADKAILSKEEEDFLHRFKNQLKIEGEQELW